MNRIQLSARQIHNKVLNLHNIYAQAASLVKVSEFKHKYSYQLFNNSAPKTQGKSLLDSIIP
jgi:hypothetical protein